MIEMRHLRYAVAIADEGHVTRAAEKLGIQQPPLSQQIRSLEAMVGTALFHRLPRGVVLTDAGAVFVARARQILSDLNEAVEETQRAARGETGTLSIGFTSSAAFHPLVSSAVRGLRFSLPELALRLEEGATDELTADLLARRVDVAFLRGVTVEAVQLSVEHVHQEDMVLAMPDDHALAHPHQKGTLLDLTDLAGETFIFYRRQSGQGLYDRIIAACHRAGFSPKVGQDAPKLASTLSLVAAGLGVSIIPESMARLETSGIAYRRFSEMSGLYAPLYLAWRPEPARAAVTNLINEVKIRAAQLQAPSGR